MSRFETIARRYATDVDFHQLVDLICKHVCELRLTPGEARDAAMLASLMFERNHLGHVKFDVDAKIDLSRYDARLTESYYEK